MFGEISFGEMILNKFGEIVQNTWFDLPNYYKNIELDEFVIMPNHIHMVVVIKPIPVGAGSPRPFGESDNDVNNRAREPRPYKNGATIKKPTLGQIVAYFKYQSAKRINEIRNMPGFPVWQRNYYEHIIRDENELNQIREYIRTNPQN